MDSLVGGVVSCDAFEGVESERGLDLTDFGYHCLDSWTLLQNNLPDDLAIGHLCITEIHVDDIADDFEASWDLDSRWQHLLQHLLEAVILIVKSQLVRVVHLELLLQVVLNERRRPDDTFLHKNEFVVAIFLNRQVDSDFRALVDV